MENADWRQRLKGAIESSGKSMREVSLASGHSPGYVHSIFTEMKDPKITTLISVCEAIPVSLIYVLHGFEVNPEDERLLKELHEHPTKRDAIRNLISG